MRVFVTGATGFIGSAIVRELQGAGHQVLGMARSEEGVDLLRSMGAEPHRGDVQDLDSLRRGASQADGVIHAAFIHDFSRFLENCEIDRRAIEALGDALAGRDARFVVTSGTAVAGLGPDHLVTEEDESAPASAMPRAASEEAAAAVAARGVSTSILRLAPSVHSPDRQGLVTMLIARAREAGVSAYVGDGLNRWPAVHRLDAARLFRLALEKGAAWARYHAVDEEGVPLREIAEVIGRRLKVPVVGLSPDEAAQHFGWLAPFAGADCPASSAITRERLGWRPTGPSLIADLEMAPALEI